MVEDVEVERVEERKVEREEEREEEVDDDVMDPAAAAESEGSLPSALPVG